MINITKCKCARVVLNSVLTKAKNILDEEFSTFSREVMESRLQVLEVDLQRSQELRSNMEDTEGNINEEVKYSSKHGTRY